MEEKHIKKDLSAFYPQDIREQDDRTSKRILIPIFSTILVIALLGFRFRAFQKIIVYMIAFVVVLTGISALRKRDKQNIKELVIQIAFIPIVILGIFSEFFSDLIMAYLAILATGIIVLLFIGIDNQKIKIQLAYYTLLGAILLALALHYDSIIELLGRIL